MGIEAISNTAANYQNTRPQVQPVSSTTSEVSTSNAQNPIAQEVLTVQANGNADNGGYEGNNAGGKNPSEETVRQTLSEVNKKLKNTECVWGVDDATNRITIKIVDKETKDVIKELPPEKTLEMIAKAWELAGVLVDEKL